MSSPGDGSQSYLVNIPYGFTTTPDQRLGPGPPYTNPALQANLFFRVFLGIIAVMVSWIPARLLWRNGEFAATVFCFAVVIRNIGYIINALIWRDDNVADWYAGYGWCDLQVYITFAMDTAFNTCLFEIMRSLYSKVSLDRVTSLTSHERLRKQVISAAVIFTVPVIQVALTFFLMVRRYNVSTLVGCTALYHFDWLFFVFYVLPTPVFVVLAAILAVLVFIRFRRIERLTREVVHSHNSVMSARQHRVRRKLYFMTLGILVIVVPLICALFVLNIADGYSYWSDPYDFDLIHHGPDPFNIYFISFTTSDMVRFVDMNINYIPTLTAMVIFFVFGTTTEGLNDYRRLLLFLGLGPVFPKLHEEYNPDSRRSGKSWLSSLSRIFPNRGTRLPSHGSSSTKDSQCPTVGHISHASTASQSCNRESGSILCSGARGNTEDHNPWPDLSETDVAETLSTHPKIPNRNPWLFRTMLATAPFRIPAISLPAPGNKEFSEKLPEKSPRVSSAPPQLSPSRRKVTNKIAEEGDSPSNVESGGAAVWGGTRVDTRVWANSREDQENESLGGVRVETEMCIASTIEHEGIRMQGDPTTGRS